MPRRAATRASRSTWRSSEIVRPDGETIDFDIDPFKKHCLLNGLDDIALTLQKDDKIGAFEDARKTAQPWA